MCNVIKTKNAKIQIIKVINSQPKAKQNQPQQKCVHMHEAMEELKVLEQQQSLTMQFPCWKIIIYSNQ